MSEQKGKTPAEQSEPVVFSMARSIVKGTARIGLNATSIPLSLLPPEPRTRARNAIAQLAMVPISISNGVAGFAEQVVENVTKMDIDVRGENISQRAQVFTDRLSRAAQEFTSNIAGATQQAADNVTKDEWVEKPKPASGGGSK